MSRSQGTLLGFDFGEKRIGVAVGQLVTRTASALVTLELRGGRLDWDAIAALLAQWQPQAVVVGLPLNMDGSDQPFTARARRFARQVHGRFGVPVHMMDERLSTREATERISRASTGGRSRARELRAQRDAVAAQIILEGWLAEWIPD